MDVLEIYEDVLSCMKLPSASGDSYVFEYSYDEDNFDEFVDDTKGEIIFHWVHTFAYYVLEKLIEAYGSEVDGFYEYTKAKNFALVHLTIHLKD